MTGVSSSTEPSTLYTSSSTTTEEVREEPAGGAGIRRTRRARPSLKAYALDVADKAAPLVGRDIAGNLCITAKQVVTVSAELTKGPAPKATTDRFKARNVPHKHVQVLEGVTVDVKDPFAPFLPRRVQVEVTMATASAAAFLPDLAGKGVTTVVKGLCKGPIGETVCGAIGFVAKASGKAVVALTPQAVKRSLSEARTMIRELPAEFEETYGIDPIRTQAFIKNTATITTALPIGGALLTAARKAKGALKVTKTASQAEPLSLHELLTKVLTPFMVVPRPAFAGASSIAKRTTDGGLQKIVRFSFENPTKPSCPSKPVAGQKGTPSGFYKYVERETAIIKAAGTKPRSGIVQEELRALIAKKNLTSQVMRTIAKEFFEIAVNASTGKPVAAQLKQTFKVIAKLPTEEALQAKTLFVQMFSNQGVKFERVQRSFSRQFYFHGWPKSYAEHFGKGRKRPPLDTGVPLGFDGAYYFHVTDKTGLRKILETGKVERRGHYEIGGAFISTYPELNWGRYVVAFNRKIEWLSLAINGEGSHTPIPYWWTGLSKDIPVTAETLEFIGIANPTNKEAVRAAEKCAKFAKRPIQVVPLTTRPASFNSSHIEVIDAGLEKKKAYGILIPKQWEAITW